MPATLCLVLWLWPLSQSSFGSAAQDLYSELSLTLAEFETYLGSRWSGERHAVTFGAELLSANSHRGEALLSPESLAGNILYLDRLQALGVRGVTVQITYPLVLTGFPRSREYLAFYRALAAEVKRRGLALHVKTGPTFTQSEFSNVPVSYRNLTVLEYFAGRSAQARLLAEELRPDRLTFGNEPSTEESITGLDLNVVNYTAFVQSTLRGMERRGIQVGVGSGTWDEAAYVRSFAQTTSVDFIDLHLYPLSNGGTSYLERAVELAQIARASGKRVAIGEAWLYKASARELATGAASPASSPAIFARDVFSPWSPLDQRFVRALVALAHLERLDYVSFFWSKYFFAYLEPTPENLNLSPGELLRAADEAAVENILAGRYSETGLAFSRLIRFP
jgi:hypothetical protein